LRSESQSSSDSWNPTSWMNFAAVIEASAFALTAAFSGPPMIVS
jgi:hypothetical protein